MRAAEEAMHAAADLYGRDGADPGGAGPRAGDGAGPPRRPATREAAGQAKWAASGVLALSVRFVLRRPEGCACVCRLNFSPDSELLLCCTEEPNGNPFGQVCSKM
jgi:hypothetical protein